MYVPIIFKKILPLCILLIASYIIIFPIFNQGFLVHVDNPLHLAESNYLIKDLLPKHHWITGWCNYDLAGFPIFLYSYNLGFWIIALLNIFFSMDIELAYKIALYISYIFPIISLYILMEHRFRFKIAFITSAVLLLSSRDLQIILGGMWNQYLSIGFLILFIHESEFYFKDPNLKNTTILGVLLSFTILSHPFSAFVAIYYLFIYLLVNLSSKDFFEIKSLIKDKLLLSFFWMSIVIFAMTWYFIIPLIETSGWIKSVFSLPTGSIYQILFAPINNIFLFNLSYPSISVYQLLVSKNFSVLFIKLFLVIFQNLPQLVIGIIALIGSIFLIKTFYRKSINQFFFVILLFTSLSYLISTGIISIILSSLHLPFIILIYYRFNIYTKIGIFILFGFSLFNLKQLFIDSSISNYMYQKFNIKLIKLLDLKNIFFFLFLLILIMNYNYIVDIKPLMVTSSSDQTFLETKEVWSWISNNVNGSESRVFYESFEQNQDYKNLSHLWALSTLYTNVPSLSGWCAGLPYRIENNIESFQGRIFNTSMTDISDEQIKNNLELLNAKYIVTSEPILTQKVTQSKLFKKEIEISNFTIFSLINYSPEWVMFKNNVTYQISTFDDDQVIIKIYNNTKNNTLLFKTQYHPYWHASINNEPVKVGIGQDYLISLDLPSEPILTVNMFYKPFPTIFYGDN